MLNEIREFYEYIDLSTLDTTRLVPNQILIGLDKQSVDTLNEKSKGFTHLNGIERPMTIIARRYIFHDENNINKIIKINEENKTERLAYAKNKVIKWFEEDFRNIFIPNALDKKVNGNPDFDKDLLNIIKQNAQINFDYIINLRWKKDIDEATGELKGRTEKSIFSNRNAELVNMWYYDTIIADALNEGPLQNIKLLVSNDFIDIIKKSTKKYQSTLIRYIKIIALYYLKSTDEKRYPYILFPNIACWFNFTNRKNQSPINNLKLNIFGEKINVFDKAPYKYAKDDTTVIQKLSNELYDYLKETDAIQFTTEDNITPLQGYTLIEDNE